MGLLDLPILVFRFPRNIENEKDLLVLEIDATGDVYLELPNELEASIKAVKAFSVFWVDSDQKNLIKLLQKMFEIFNDWEDPLRLISQWNNYKGQLEKEFRDIVFDLKSTGLKELFLFLKGEIDLPSIFLSKRRPLRDVTLLEVRTKSRNSLQPLIITQIDWKGDFSHVITPAAIGRDDVFSCHAKGVELALFIKAVLRDFLVRLMKKTLIML